MTTVTISTKYQVVMPKDVRKASVKCYRNGNRIGHDDALRRTKLSFDVTAIERQAM